VIRRKAVSFALPVRRRRALHWISVGVWVTGGVWLIYKYFIRVTDDFGFESPHPLQHWWLIAHAGFSFAAVWMFGVLWPGHVLRGWRMKTRRPTGGTLFGVIAWLTLSGYALYYVASETLRSWTSILHWVVGLVAIVPFLLHRRHGGAAHEPEHPRQSREHAHRAHLERAAVSPETQRSAADPQGVSSNDS
jgi:hypothetical protein